MVTMVVATMVTTMAEVVIATMGVIAPWSRPKGPSETRHPLGS